MTLSRPEAVPEETFYVAGGNLKPGAHSYVVRPADDDLFGSLRDGVYSYVLTSRQMGKSSLMHRTAQRLQAVGTTPILLDLTSIGANLTVDQWYFGLLAEIGTQLSIKREIGQHWSEDDRHGPLDRFTRALSHVVLPHCEGPLVIFIDEIDFVRSLKFSTDEFFAAIRHCHNNRASNPSMRRLTFCLLGVATAADLIRDVRTTPFNIGRQIELTDFSLSEAEQFESRLHFDPKIARRMLDRVMHWTDGHPYLTQKLCLAVSQNQSDSIDHVDRACRELFLTKRRRMSEDNLIFVHNALRTGGDDPVAVINRYRQVLSGRRTSNDPADPVIAQLRLTGVVRPSDGLLRVRNRIYAQVFDGRWINENLPDAELRRERTAFRRGLFTAIAASGAILAIMAGLVYKSVIAERKANQAQADYKAQLADANYQRALDDLTLAQRALDEPNISHANALLVESANLTSGAMMSRFEWRYLWALRHLEIQTSGEFKSPVIGVWSSSPGEITCLTCDGEVRTWKIADASPLRSLNLGTSPFAVAYSSHGRYFAANGQADCLFVYDAKSSKPIAILHSKRDLTAITSLVFSPSTETLLWSSPDGTIGAWHWRRQTPPKIVQISSGPISSADVSKSGSEVATCLPSTNEVLFVSSDLSSRNLRRIKCPFTPYTVKFSPDRSLLAIGCAQGRIELRDAVTGKVVRCVRRSGGAINRLAFSSDGRILAAAGTGSTVDLWNVRAGRRLERLTGHTDAIQSLSFIDRNRSLITGAADHSIKLWRVPQLAPLMWATSADSSVSILPKHRYLTLNRKLVEVRQEGRRQPCWNLDFKHKGLRSWVVSSNGSTLATLDNDNNMTVIDTLNGAVLAVIPMDRSTYRLTAVGTNGSFVVLGSQGATTLAALDSAGKYIPVSTIKSDLPIPAYAVGDVLALGSGDGKSIDLWRLGRHPTLSRKSVYRSDSHLQICDVALSPKGNILAITNRNGSGAIIDSRTGKVLHALPETNDQGLFVGLAFSPDGQTLCTASLNGTVRFWDVATGEETIILAPTTGLVKSIRFDEDALVLATSDGVLHEWEAPSTTRPRLDSRVI